MTAGENTKNLRDHDASDFHTLENHDAYTPKRHGYAPARAPWCKSVMVFLDFP